MADHASSPSARPEDNHDHHGHTVEAEFGTTRDRVEHHQRANSDLTEPSVCDPKDWTPETVAKCPNRRRRQLTRLRRRLVHQRWLRQYFREEGVLVREKELRRTNNEELFLDLIIVANIAAIGHELRHTFGGWPEIETFILLFGAIFSSWRALAFFWNMFGTKGDLVDKIAVYFTLTALSGIGVGAHGAFTTARSYVAFSAFLATFLPAFAHLVLVHFEPHSKNEHNLYNQGTAGQLLILAPSIVYLIAAFVGEERTTRNLYWVAFGLVLFLPPLHVFVYSYLHRNRSKAVRLAVNIEALVDKYDVLTLIVLGESLIGLLFEGAELVTKEGARIGRMYLAVVISTLIVYTAQTLYFNVDNFLPKGATHAIRHNRYNGLIWSMVHVPYHMSLAGFLPTGLGLIIRDVTLFGFKADDEATTERLIRVSAEASAESSAFDGGVAQQFNSSGRWLFAVGWGAAFLISALTGLVHSAGPRGKTKNKRILIRAVIVIAVMLSIAFASISALETLAIVAAVSCFIGLSEFVLVAADSIGLLTGSPVSSTAPSTAYSGSAETDSEHEDDDLDKDEVGKGELLGLDAEGDRSEQARAPADPERGLNATRDDDVRAQAELEARNRARRHRMRFEAIAHPVRCARYASHGHH